MLTRAAHAKINLFLHVLSRLPNGYHEIQSALTFLTLADKITFEPADSPSLTISGSFAAGISAEDNLVMRAAKALHPTRGARIHLEKNIPHGAGLGGGSADAAASLLALDELWELHTPPAELTRIAASLGSDVPACLDATPKRMEGTGHTLAPLTLPQLHVLLVWPAQGLSTADVYARATPSGMPVNAWDLASIMKYRNDLEPAACQLLPELRGLIDSLAATPNCLFARMSGSGSACFAVYEHAEDARAAQQAIAAHHPQWYSVATHTLEGVSA